jgi:putative ABC transport system ATP-binding protein
MNANQAHPSGLICRSLVKDYGTGDARVRALRSLNLDIAPGQLTLLIGPSGCGKTTLLSILAGTLDPSAGVVSVLGTDLAKLKPQARAAFRAEHVGFVFQHYNLLPALTLAENVAIPLIIGGSTWDAALPRARETLEAVGLAGRAEARPGQLSGGQQQRVAIARALIHRPRLLLCDEPTSNLDAQTGQTIMQLIRAVAVQPDRVVVVVTHDPRVYDFADRIIALEDGQVVSSLAGSASDGASKRSARQPGRVSPLAVRLASLEKPRCHA